MTRAALADVLAFGALNRRRRRRLYKGLMGFMKGEDYEAKTFAIRAVLSKCSRRIATVVPNRTWAPRVSVWPREAVS